MMSSILHPLTMRNSGLAYLHLQPRSVQTIPMNMVELSFPWMHSTKDFEVGMYHHCMYISFSAEKIQFAAETNKPKKENDKLCIY
mmetsp:Transcript_38323/g.69060  ORF Transcript_38323/g.69060 Transcript_38323/m.69060 type:complete len:85 (-) Transcript_38323:119-373(-)